MKCRGTITLLAAAPAILAIALGTGCTHSHKEPSTTPTQEPRNDLITHSPGPGYSWIGGKWVWTGKSHYWKDTRWEAWPIPNGRWVPGYWRETHDGKKEWVEGHWR